MSQSGGTRLSALETQALQAWKGCQPEYGFGFRKVAENSGTPPHLVRRVVRALARKGLVSYERTLCFEDDGQIGAGYVLTRKGWEMING